MNLSAPAFDTPKTRLGTPVFICGHAKSGTTLLAALLDGHPDILAFPEETFFLRQWFNRQNLSPKDLAGHFWNGIQRKAVGFANDQLPDRWSFDYFDGNFEHFEQAFFDGNAQHPSEILPNLLRAYADTVGLDERTYWLEKTHGNEIHLDTLSDWYPSLRMIYIIRDPRDVYVSWIKRQKASGKKYSLERFICRWAESVGRFRQFRGQKLLVRYETLLTHPQETLQSVCDFLEIPYDPAVEQPTKAGRLWQGNSMHGQAFSAISTAPIGRWRVSLSDEDLRMIEVFFGRILPTFNYKPTRTYSPLHIAANYPRFTGHYRRLAKSLGLLYRKPA